MELLFYLLCLFALLGAVDIGYFHIYRLRLYRAYSSRWEHMTHLIRELLFILAFSWVMFIQAQGIWAVGLPLILLVDLVNSLADVALEPKSRASFGGLPPAEYFIHMVTMFVSGAAMAIAAITSVRLIPSEPTFCFQVLGVPALALLFGWQLLLGTFLLFLFEMVCFVRARK